MNCTNPSEPVAVGIQPWLPWPLCAWQWWTRPVSAERLAILRIGLGACLLADLWFTYRPHIDDFFAPGGLGSPDAFAWYGRAPYWNWSILRGFGDPILSTLALIGLGIATVLIALDFAVRLTSSETGRWHGSAWRLPAIWIVSATFVVLGVWSRTMAEKEAMNLAWAVPLGMLSLASAFVALEFWHVCGRAELSRCRLAWLVSGLGLFLFLTVACKLLPFEVWAEEIQPSLTRRLLSSWQQDRVLLHAAYWTWFIAAAGLLVGLCTRCMAITAWVLSVSFAHVNCYIDNAGDVVRGIILFHLMFCPCGAAWSLDAFLRRRWTGDRAPRLVFPWPLRLLFMQMTLIYFANGVCKAFGPTWTSGESFYLVLGDVTLTRFAPGYFGVPYFVMFSVTWIVLIWEAGFPLWVALPRTRSLALVLGVLFHLGIFLALELGGFGPYMLTLYLPLLPLRRWRNQEKSNGELQATSMPKHESPPGTR